ncbi:hypothetical protein [Sulfuricella denitrificans]|uniref:hypothetical protein n=1 Tax=Sulfuricella denitrificans TaxID=649841 RepID=UPI0011D2708E|nr:hypothetical protein [Sulfuricella denitrificans]
MAEEILHSSLTSLISPRLTAEYPAFFFALQLHPAIWPVVSTHATAPNGTALICINLLFFKACVDGMKVAE